MIELVEYKAKLVGIRVTRTPESYTSKASALDFDPIPDYDATKKGTHTFSGTRGPSMKALTKKVGAKSYKARGLYKTKKGLYIHSDVNAAFNIGRKQFPNAFGKKNITQKQMLLSPIKVKV